MPPELFTDEELMAFADGELDAARMEEIARALEGDEALARRVAIFSNTSPLAFRAMKTLLDEKVPPALERRVAELAEQAAQAGAPIPFRRAAPVAANSQRQSWHLPLAASLALAIGGLGGFYAAGTIQGDNSVHVAAAAEPYVSEVLNSAAQGESRALAGKGTLRAIATFRDAEGALCREFEHDRTDGSAIVAVACHEQEAWQIRIAVAASRAGGEFAPASSLESIEAYMSATGASPALSLSEEEKALKDISASR